MTKTIKNPIAEEYAKKWHPTLNGDLTPADYSAGSKVKVHWVCETYGHSYYKSIQDVTKGGGCSVCSGFQVCVGFNDFESKFPDIAKEWHPTRNGDSKPTDFTYGSKYDAFWMGSCGHEYQATINRRVSLGNGCPYCSGQKILIGFNDLPTTHPEIVKQWDYDHNNTLPTEYTAGTNKKVYWLGTCGHSFLNSVSEKIRSAETGADGCPYCAGKQILKGFNDLESQYPLIAKEWSPKNKKRADEVLFRSTLSVLWTCPEGHEYKTGIRQRTLSNAGCRYCKGQLVIAGQNDFATLFPLLAQEWDVEKNADISMYGIPSTSPHVFWWKCLEDDSHSYQASITSKTDKRSKNNGCAICDNRAVQTGINDLATTHPEIVKEWDYSKNDIHPSTIGRWNGTPVWWMCKRNHSFCVSPSLRIRRDGYVSSCMECLAYSYSSSAEKEIVELLVNLGERVVSNNRSLLGKNEIDIYLPERNIAIEFNGLYWHSLGMNGKTKNYHYDKYKKCSDLNIQLIQIWEDDWRDKKLIVIRSLLNKISITDEELIQKVIPNLVMRNKVYARKTFVNQTSNDIARVFLNENHIQGFVSGTHYLSLKNENDENVAMMVLKKISGNNFEISRYATDRNVVGGFSKLLKYAERYFDVQTFVTFSDNCISDGSLYKNNGFIVDKIIAPDYKYLVKGKREHKFSYRIKRFKNDNTLLYKEGMTEFELATMNKIRRIYDAGKIRWVKSN